MLGVEGRLDVILDRQAVAIDLRRGRGPRRRGRSGRAPARRSSHSPCPDARDPAPAVADSGRRSSERSCGSLSSDTRTTPRPRLPPSPARCWWARRVLSASVAAVYTSSSSMHGSVRSFVARIVRRTIRARHRREPLDVAPRIDHGRVGVSRPGWASGSCSSSC